MLKREKLAINKVLIVIAVISSVFAVALILLPYINKANLETKIKSMDQMQVNYTTTESNTWDISKNEDGSVTATLDENGLLTISGEGKMKDWETSLSVPWYSIREKIKQVKIDEGLTNIEVGTFYECSNLTEVIIPSSITSIEDSAFHGCTSLMEIIIPDSVSIIGNFVFRYCSSLTEIIIPSSVTSIGDRVFYGCSSLTNIKVEENNTQYIDDNGVLYTKDKKEMIAYPAGKKDNTYTIFSETTNIRYKAFSGCSNLSEVTIPEGITTIRTDALKNCDNLTIICYKGSTAETYAQENEIPYEIIYLKSEQQTIEEETLIIRGIEPKTTVEEIKTTIESNVPYEIINKSGEVLEDTEIIGTEYTLKMCTGETYKIIVWGDINGDGEIKISELARASRIGISEEEVAEAEMIVMDVNMDGNIKINDLAAISRLACK